MEIRTDPYASSGDQLIVRELESLIGLAEECVDKIDSLTASLEKLRVSFLLFFVISLVLLVSIVGFVVSVQGSYLAFFSASLGWLVFASLGGCIVTVVAWLLGSGQSRRRSLLRKLYAEKDVHERLITLIHEQTQRAAHRRVVSPVTFAMLEIRVRRLMR